MVSLLGCAAEQGVERQDNGTRTRTKKDQLMTEETYSDILESLKKFYEEKGLTEEAAVVNVGGIMIGLALWARHTDYTVGMYEQIVTAIATREGGSVTAFGLMAAGLGGDDRTLPEIEADEIRESIPI